MKSILVVLPSRGRPEKIEGFYDTWRKTTSGYSEVISCLDADDPTLKKYKKHKDIKIHVGKGKSMCDTCNIVLKKFPNYKYYFVVSDDIRLRTKKWEERFTHIIEKNGGKGVVYGNDLMYGEELAMAQFFSGNIYRALGYFAPPGLIHMWIDRFWTELGKSLGKLFYFPDIIVEHMHFTVGKSPRDTWYLAVNNKRVFDHDKEILTKWNKEQKKKAIKKIEAYIELAALPA